MADGLAFPLIELPEETPLNDIADAILHVILDHQAARLRRVAEIHERFTAVALAGGRTRDVVLALQPLLDRPVAVVDPDGAIVAAEPVEAWNGIEADAGLLEHQIRAGEEHFGTIVVRSGSDGLDEEAGVAIERAAVAIALRQVQARAVAEAHEGFAAVSLEELVSGQVTDVDHRGHLRIIAAHVPLAETFGYATTLRSITQGRASYTMEFDHYDEVPASMRDQIGREQRQPVRR